MSWRNEWLSSRAQPNAGVHVDESSSSMRAIVRLHKALRTSLATVDDYLGRIDGRDCVGMDAAALKARWDAEHPGDPLELAVPAPGRAA